jgi:putative lipoic acid-binding regulatory protein
MFTFKAIGDHHDEFLAEVLNQVITTLGDTRNLQHSVRMYAAGNHAAVSINIHCLSAEEVHGVYLALLKVEGLRALF